MGKMVRVRASQKWFTDEEVSRLFTIGLDDLRSLARTKQVGIFEKAAEAAGVTAGRLLFTLSDLMVLSVLLPKLQH